MATDHSDELPVRRLGRTGLALPIVGVGCSDFGNRNRVLDEGAAIATVDRAIADGLSYFDTAPYYGFGLSERRVGDALRARPAASYILSTKVGRLLEPAPGIDVSTSRNNFHSAMPFAVRFDYSYDGVMRSYEASLQRLGLARIDLLLVHDLGAFAHRDEHEAQMKAFETGIRALEELKGSEDIAAWGLGVNECAVCDLVLDRADPDCFLLAGRYTLLDHAHSLTLFERCAARRVGIIAAGPYNTGLLAGGTRREGALRYDYGPAPVAVLDRVRALEALCDRYGIPIAAAALQFPLAHPACVSVLPGLGSAARVAETRKLADYRIPAGFWAEALAEGLIHPQAPVPNAVGTPNRSSQRLGC